MPSDLFVPSAIQTVALRRVQENVRIELNDISQNAINDPSGFLAGDKGKSGAGEPVISIDSADRIDFYVKEE